MTPFRGGILDEVAFKSLIERQISAGVHGLVAAGTTGEASTLDEAEYKRLIETAVSAGGGRRPVIAGSGTNDTRKTIELTRFAKIVGADAALIVTPYYNKPNQEGVYAHYMAIADAVELPIFLYNVPHRTNVDLAPETVGRLARHPNIIGIKDASGALERVALHRGLCGAGFLLIGGDDGNQVGFNAQGGRGCISVTANVAPELCVRMQEACLAGDYGTAQEINFRLARLHKALFAEPSPGPVKYAAQRLGIIPSAECRLPIPPVTDPVKALVDAALAEAGLL